MKEKSLIAIVAKIGPWAAPIPTAWAVGLAAINHFAWPWWVAVACGVALESVGIGSVYIALTLWNYNQGKRKTDPEAPFDIAVATVVVYFISALALAVLIDAMPALTTWSVAVFPILSIAGAVVLALYADHDRRIAQIEAEKAERKAERAPHHPPAAPDIRPQEPESVPQPTPDKTYTCASCGASFESSQEKASHMRWGHPKAAKVPSNGHSKEKVSA